MDTRLEMDCREAGRINKDNLKKLLKDNRDTSFGKEYGFSEIKSVDEFWKKVPLQEYGRLKADIERMFTGEDNVLTAYPVFGYCLSSGTEGERKHIPLTFEALRRYSDHIERCKKAVFSENPGKRLFLNGFRIGMQEENRKDKLLSELYYQYLFQQGLLSFDDYAGGEEALFDQFTGEELFYVKAWIGFCTEEVTVLESIFLYDQLLFFQYIERNWETLLTHMRKGQIPEDIFLSEKVSAHLCAMPVNEQRLCRVEEVCAEGFEAIGKRLWPGLALASGISNPSFSREEELLRFYLGEVPVSYFSYVASECHMGVAAAPEDCSFIMLPQSAFYEYLPYEEEGCEKETLLPGEVKAGSWYEPVLTTFSGLYRYRLGDVIEVCGFYGESPVIRFLFRKNQRLNGAGEKMTGWQIEQAVREMKEKHKMAFSGYCIALLEDSIPVRYGCVFAVAEEKKTAPEEAARWIDEAFCRRNVDYSDVRELGFLGAPEVLLVTETAYLLFLEEAGLMQGHRKPIHTAKVFSKEIWSKWKKRKEQTGWRL